MMGKSTRHPSILVSVLLLVAIAFTSNVSCQVPFTDADWSAAIVKAKAFVLALTDNEKVNIVTGVGWNKGKCVGNTPAIARMNYTGLCLHDSPTGVRGIDLASAFPAAINAATTWNRTLIYEQAKAMSEEFRGKGVNVALGPMMNLLRVPAAGRNWEGYGGDPYLSGEAAYQAVLGIQSQGVIACSKHYIGNEQEHFRTSGSTNMDERTLHEMYGWPFMRTIKAGVASVMCSYNLVNGTYACENGYTLNTVLKGEYQFRGFIMSDWDATMSGVKSVNAGLDMTMPGDIGFGSGRTYFGTHLLDAISNGTMTALRLNDMCVRIMTAYYLLKQDQNYPAVNFDFFNPNNGKHVNVQGDHYKVIRKVGADSTVLLKNTLSALPFTNFVTTGTYSYNVTTPYNCTVPNDGTVVPIVNGTNGTVPANITITCYNTTTITKNRYSYAIIGTDAGPSVGGPNACSDHGCNTGTLAQGWGSGTSLFPYLITPLDGITKRAAVYNQTIRASLNNTDLAAARGVAMYADVAIVCVNADSGEGYITVEGRAGDRNDLSLWHGGDDLIRAVAAVNPNTVVVMHVVGPVTMPWINHPNITAVVLAGLPGQESGNALADVLFGDVVPSGKLPYTIGVSASDYPAQIVTAQNQLPIVYREGLNIDYRWFDSKKITPLFPFGFGLSYTTFAYADLKITRVNPFGSIDDVRANVLNAGLPVFKNKNYQQAAKDLDYQETVQYEITFTITNTGSYDGEEVAQLYLDMPDAAGEPPKILRGFEKVLVKKGQTVTVTLHLTDLECSIYDAPTKSWQIPQGEFGVMIGASSRDIRLTGSFVR